MGRVVVMILMMMSVSFNVSVNVSVNVSLLTCLHRQTGPVDHGLLSVILPKRNAKWKGWGRFFGADATATLDTHTWPVGYSSGKKKIYNGSSVNAASPGDRHSDLTAESAPVQ
ncbi:hypothetical protein T4A_6907 [Trichinella pseudospiralis]|uniref:Uncharacterized protein n=1 Tax=Trichinella pseudospiralis TaxID=6337 RepID=A0A0V1E0U8_TRIPS|nr:hypothetical protein T4A_6907 [Trichinella pseudospiralis]KRZ35732.1 hypothetical protein T4C_3119 [Trichinella pseudospiralis]